METQRTNAEQRHLVKVAKQCGVGISLQGDLLIAEIGRFGGEPAELLQAAGFEKVSEAKWQRAKFRADPVDHGAGLVLPEDPKSEAEIAADAEAAAVSAAAPPAPIEASIPAAIDPVSSTADTVVDTGKKSRRSR